MAEVKKEYKDRLFNFIFGREENKAWTLSLYNAVNGSSYTNPDDIQINTIREVLYLGMHNDVSFLISGDLNLYEQQSTYNPNMPVRMLQYAGHLYERYIKENRLNKYGSEVMQLPTPKLVVFYNGTKEIENEVILKLSDSFPKGAESDIEVKVRMINVNYGESKKILEACKPMYEYSWLIQTIRDYKNENEEIEKAVDRAISDMPEKFEIKSFLETHRAEVNGMLLEEYKEEEVMELFKEDGRKEGMKEGMKEGKEATRISSIRSLMETLHLTTEQAMDALKIPQDERHKYASL